MRAEVEEPGSRLWLYYNICNLAIPISVLLSVSAPLKNVKHNLIVQASGKVNVSHRPYAARRQCIRVHVHVCGLTILQVGRMAAVVFNTRVLMQLTVVITFYTNSEELLAVSMHIP